VKDEVAGTLLDLTVLRADSQTGLNATDEGIAAHRQAFTPIRIAPGPGLEKPPNPPPPVARELQQELPLMATMGDMPGPLE